MVPWWYATMVYHIQFIRDNYIILRRYQTVNQMQRSTTKQKRREIQNQIQQPQSNQDNGQNVTLKDALDKLYEDIESAPSYSAKIEAYLRSNTVHSRHRRIVKKKFPRRKIISRFPFDRFVATILTTWIWHGSLELMRIYPWLGNPKYTNTPWRNLSRKWRTNATNNFKGRSNQSKVC